MIKRILYFIQQAGVSLQFPRTHFHTQSAKQLMQSLKDSNPHDWWWQEFVEKGVNYGHLNSRK